MIKRLFKNFKEEAFNLWFGFLLLSIVFYFFIDIFTSSRFLKIIALILFFITLLMYNIKITFKRKLNFLDKSLHFLILFIVLSTTLFYLAVSLSEMNIAGIIAFIANVVILIGGLFSLLSSLLDSKNIWILIPRYFLFSFVFILSFAFIFNLTDIFEGNDIRSDKTDLMMKGKLDYFYFSSAAYFSSSYGEFYPIGIIMRMLTQIEVALSYIFHIIILGLVIQKIVKKK